MKMSEFIEEAKKLQKEHGDLEVKGTIVGSIGPASIVLTEEVNYATPKPHLRTPYFRVGYINYKDPIYDEPRPTNFRPAVKRA